MILEVQGQPTGKYALTITFKEEKKNEHRRTRAAKLKAEIQDAVVKAGLAEKAELPEVLLETPKDKTHGDYSTNMAMQLARIAKKHRVLSLKSL